MAVKYRYIVTVRGYGNFPIDMLRYDRATPDTEADSHVIERTEERMVIVRMDREPTRGRWESFGWEVTNIRRERAS